MTTIEEFLAVTDPLEVVPRDSYGRPKIKQPDGKLKAYTRATTYVKCLEDTFNLEQWSQRRVARGLVGRPDLVLAVQSLRDEYDPALTDAERKAVKTELNAICAQAKEAAGSSAAATIGTALHKMTERLDRGEAFAPPDTVKADLEAYRAATAHLQWRHIERITVNDDLQVAGTPDRIADRIADVKTGDISYGIGAIAMQLAMYAHSDLYDPATGERTPLEVDQEWATIIHLPALTGTCTLVDVDIAAGWEAVQIAREVRAWRARKNLTRPHRPDLTALIEAAPTPDALLALWREHKATWTEQHSALAAQRKAALVAA